jgi:LPS-assembly lipoprotein
MISYLRPGVVALAVFLSACGFSPVYGPHSDSAPVTESLGQILITNIPDRQGQMLKNHLIDRLYVHGRPSSPDAKLDVSLHSTEVDLGVQKDATASRRQYNLWADYVLRSMDDHQLAKGTAHSVVSYSKLDAQYGTVMTEKNAQERATTEVGEQIVNRLSLYYAERAEPKSPPPHDDASPAP